MYIYNIYFVIKPLSTRYGDAEKFVNCNHRYIMQCILYICGYNCLLFLMPVHRNGYSTNYQTKVHLKYNFILA